MPGCFKAQNVLTPFRITISSRSKRQSPTKAPTVVKKPRVASPEADVADSPLSASESVDDATSDSEAPTSSFSSNEVAPASSPPPHSDGELQVIEGDQEDTSQSIVQGEEADTPETKATVPTMVPLSALEAALKAARECHLDSQHIDHCGEDLVGRLARLAVYADATKGIYTIMKCPLDGRWNDFSPFDKAESFLRLGNSNKPLVLWAVGEVVDSSLVSVNGNPPWKVNVSLKPLDSHIRAFCAKLLHGLADPPDSTLSGYWTDGCVNFSAWTSKRGEKARNWDEVYDASARLLSKSAMVKLPAGDVQPGDLVLVEAYIVRYTNKDTRVKGSAAWNNWLTVMTMLSVSVLQKVPSNLPVPASALPIVIDDEGINI
ncbi:hypothetical protein B0H10DRAFT_1969072 [Mycena sp. CBHHK59/15]|nr:hypothetical protein B0H10DRAFT_1969072 [Mycena sp. CBHHK59/15]